MWTYSVLRKSIILSFFSLFYLTNSAFGTTWTPLGNVSNTVSQNSFAYPSLDTSNTNVVVWEHFDGSNTVIQGSSGLGTISILSTSGLDSLNPMVGVSDLGVGIAVWQSTLPLANVIQASLYVLGSWSVPVNLSSILAGTFAENPCIAVNGLGLAVVVYEQLVGGISTVFATLYNGITWLAPVQLSSIAIHCSSPKVAYNNAGEAIVVWSATDNVNSFIQSAILSAGVFGSPTTISPLVDEGDQAQVAINASGDGFAVWSQYDGNSNLIQVAHYTGGSWAAYQIISGAGTNGEDPQISINDAGNAAACWKDSDDLRIYSSIFNGGVWSTATAISNVSTESNSNAIKIDASDDVISIWLATTPTTSEIQSSANSGGTWGAIDLVSAVGEEVMEPAIAINDSGELFAVWSELDGSNWTIQAASATQI